MTKNDKAKIMVVEDEAVIALRLQKRLKVMGYDVVGVSYSGEEVVEKARILRPDLILMDIMIPGKLDGINVAEMVKSELDIPVIFLTAFSEDKIIERAKKAEPFGYILKPFQDREIKAAIEVAFYKKKMERALKESEEKFRALAENANDGILIASGHGEHVYANKQAAEITGYSISELLKIRIKNLADPDEFEKIKERYCKIISGKSFQNHYETRIIHKDGKKIPIEVASAKSDWGGQPADIVVIRDITERIKAEKALHTAHDELERRVKERTLELNDALKTLQRSEKELSQRKLSLEKVNKELMETNQAVSVLARNIDKKKEELEKKIFRMCNGKLLPILKGLQNDVYCQKRQADLELIINYLNEITRDSPLYREIDSHLTGQEMRVAVMIKNGLTSQQISDSLCISLHTVKTHRKNIRKKLNIDNKSVNLFTYLKSKIDAQD
jgi:PAS domain S-box-containing protein